MLFICPYCTWQSLAGKGIKENCYRYRNEQNHRIMKPGRSLQLNSTSMTHANLKAETIDIITSSLLTIR
ncbi:hypothetical protein HZ326_1602 [Fusarium oxysporum f. sp. albedinis]|nr:hypothetical protein HZ326_1602 [Fusarium oxysporum f. sp. albedinis]